MKVYLELTKKENELKQVGYVSEEFSNILPFTLTDSEFATEYVTEHAALSFVVKMIKQLNFYHFSGVSYRLVG